MNISQNAIGDENSHFISTRLTGLLLQDFEVVINFIFTNDSKILENLKTRVYGRP